MIRKRQRQDGDESNGRCSAHVRCGTWNYVVRLYKHLTFDALEDNIFPGIVFFFSPSLIQMNDNTYGLSLSTEKTPCDELFTHRPWQPCKWHGPFRCSCYVLIQLTRYLLYLERELMLRPQRPGVIIDNISEVEKQETSFLYIDTTKCCATFCLSGLPLPRRQYGPLLLSAVDNKHSINTALETTFYTSNQNEKNEGSCVLCASDVDKGTCCVCKCVVCTKCDVRCAACKQKACKACVVFGDELQAEKETRCFNCYSL